MPSRLQPRGLKTTEGPAAHDGRLNFVRANRWWLFGLMALVLGLISPAPAFAQEDPEVRAYILSVTRLYEDLEYESALTQITRARTVTHTPEDNATLSLYEGVILADMNRWAEATEAFRKALLVEPNAKLPVKVSPKVAQRFELTRNEVKQKMAAAAKPPPPSPSVREPKPSPVEIQPPDAITPSPTSDTVDLTQHGSPRPQVLVPAIAGGVLVVLGGTSWALSRQELSHLNSDDPKLATREDAHHAASKGRTLQTVGVGLMGAGVAGLGFALGWYALGPSSNKTALRVGTDGTSAFVQGRWP